MNLNQTKLTKTEWDSIEIPVSSDETEILRMIVNGSSNVNIRYNNNESLFTFLKIEYSKQMEDYIFNKYLSNRVKDMTTQYNATSFIQTKVSSNPQIKKADLIRINKNADTNLEKHKLYEYVLLEHAEKTLKYRTKNINKMEFHYYTLYKLLRNGVKHINRHILDISNSILTHLEPELNLSNIIYNAVDYIEKNENILKYSDLTLYEHQKQIITICNDLTPKLILYIAPTGTGKTLTPLGLSYKNRIIFVCAARHVGLAFARSSISVGKKVAFAFGCSSADDIRLHYFAAKDFTKNWKSGGIWKVDNSVGDKVEIMICDIKSYLCAMYYMLSFNQRENVIVYWDEPTITLDYDHHELHSIIKNNWKENLIPTMVLSSATLPKIHELTETITDFKNKFEGAEIYNIISHECKKSIPIINKNGYVVLPHYLSNDYHEIRRIVNHCENYLTLLRYFDLNELTKFIQFVMNTPYIDEKYKIDRNFISLDDIDMTSIKLYYLKVLKHIDPSKWQELYDEFIQIRELKITSNNGIDLKGNKIKKIPGGVNQEENTGGGSIYITTKDAYTLTDGPTIFLSADVEKIAKFCIQQANIPDIVMKDIMEKIEFNNNVNDRISHLTKDLEDITNQSPKDDGDDGKKGGGKDLHKCNRVGKTDNTSEIGNKLKTQLEMLKSMVKVATLNETFVPNKPHHVKKWAETMNATNAFTSNIEEETILEIMSLTGVEDSWKVLLLMGIGVFTTHKNTSYTEIMKKLADQQKLYIIIASSDYIYGTNYQFCHAYISKDMDLTQEKIIQAMGRIGRNKIQQSYTIRFRDDAQITKLFTEDTAKPEVINMNRLFSA
jgi:hypothetical protein